MKDSVTEMARFLLQCWLRWPPGRHDFVAVPHGRVCSRCGVHR